MTLEQLEINNLIILNWIEINLHLKKHGRFSNAQNIFIDQVEYKLSYPKELFAGQILYNDDYSSTLQYHYLYIVKNDSEGKGYWLVDLNRNPSTSIHDDTLEDLLLKSQCRGAFLTLEKVEL